jgi:hypothetical protein
MSGKLDKLVTQTERVFLPDANTLMNPAESFKNKQSSIFLEFINTATQKEIIFQHLWDKDLR